MRLAGSTPRNGARKYGVERYADIHGKLKPAFIHHSESKRHLKGIMEELSGGPEKTYFDVPRMRSTHAIGANR
jgi:hypothetical protein